MSNWDFSQAKWFWRIIFSKKEKITADRILREFGYTPSSERDKALFLKNARKLKDKPGVLKLIEILADAIVKSEDDLCFGSNHTTKYYIDTMGIAHNKGICATLNLLMHNLIKKAGVKFDYVYATKADNDQFLSSFVNDNDNKFSISAKIEEDKSKAVSGDESVRVQINYEGFGVLEEYIRNIPNKHKINGVAIACNVANGSTLRNSILSYNQMLDRLKKSTIGIGKVSPIKKMFVLYRAIDTCKLDVENTSVDLECIRYFDLDENKKAELYEIKTGAKNAEDFSCYKCINNNQRVSKKCKNIKCYRNL